MVTLIVLPVGVASAQTMTSAEIKAALEGNSISNENEVQYFNPDGTAIYRKGSEKVTGQWGVEGDKFCSDLNTDDRYPAEGQDRVGEWKCYPTIGDKKRISFII
ncbi:MAG: hypothetical protein AAAB36_25050, partial [Ensifer adhaerens]